jgi:L-lactate dehydrogenase complex protein LldG
VTSARDEVLARVRGALGGDAATPPVPRSYRTSGDFAPGSPELATQLVDRLEDYRAVVVRTPDDDRAIGLAVAQALSHRGIHQVIVPPGLPPEWTAQGLEVRSDNGTATPRDLDTTPAVVTGSAVAVSETGTIVLDGSARCGRRAISLVPDTHVCVVATRDIVQTVPEALRRLDPARPLTFISGPSATSDIELSRVEGVHGPRTLVVVLAG